MKKIITALGNNMLNDALKRTGKYELVTKDILYKEGILEVLEEISNIDTIIISELLEGDITFENLIEEILLTKEDIEIIVFVDSKREEIQNFLFKNGIYKIYENNEIELERFIDSLQENNNEKVEELQHEIIRMGKMINKSKIDNLNLEATGKIIAITGTYNSGKSSITCLLEKEYAKQGKKTLVIDFDIFNSSIHVLLDIPKYNKGVTATNIEEQIVHIRRNEDVLCSIDLLFSDKNTIDFVNLEQILQDLKVEYDIILIDTSSNYEYKYLSRILNNADSIVYLVVPSKVELKKSINLLEIFLKDFHISVKQFQIILNKINCTSLSKEVIKDNLKGIPITGTVKYDENIENDILNKRKNELIIKEK